MFVIVLEEFLCVSNTDIAADCASRGEIITSPLDSKQNSSSPMSHASLTLSVKLRKESTSDFDLDFGGAVAEAGLPLNFGRPGTLFKLLDHSPPLAFDLFCAVA